jgi:toxin ParE1/3/4
MQYRISEDAQRDLEEIFVYWANRASLESADRIVDKITERFWLVGEHPNAGKPAGNIARGVRWFPAGKYLIYYRNTRRGTDMLHMPCGLRNNNSPATGLGDASRNRRFHFVSLRLRARDNEKRRNN